MEDPQEEDSHQRVMDLNGGLTLRRKITNKAVIPPDNNLKYHLMEIHHNHPTARHLE